MPPEKYGGTERVISYLTEGLLQLGHEVELFAAEGSSSSAAVCPVVSSPIGMRASWEEWYDAHTRLFTVALERASEFDVIHSHVDNFLDPIARYSGSTPCVVTIHNPVNTSYWNDEMLKLYSVIPIVAVSMDQRVGFDYLNWCGVVHHGLPSSKYSYKELADGYVVFIGRIIPQKGVIDAIEMAPQAGVGIRVIGSEDTVGPHSDLEYSRRLRTFQSHPLVEFVGELDDHNKERYLRNAMALIFPTKFREAFGLAVVEALACGVPVISYGSGAVPELLDHGKTGFVVDSVEEGADAIRSLCDIDRGYCRAVFEARFTSLKMAKQYVQIFEQLLRPSGDSKGST